MHECLFFFQIKFSDTSNFYLEHVLDKLVHIYICSVHKVMGLSEFLLENAFFLQRLEARGGDRFVNHPHNFTLTWDSVHSRVNSEMQRDREDSLVLGPPTRV